ncbi:MAG: carbamoyltransferase HypF [Bacillota bacterium]
MGVSQSYRIIYTGTVQGVGFRPYVYNLALTLGLCGSVGNTGEGVLVELEGEAEEVNKFIREVEINPPPLARISKCDVVSAPRRGLQGFTILPSEGFSQGASVVPPDAALCAQCREEILSRRDRRYLYPFTNCTNCGPRFTISSRLPYDRVNTTMAVFPMCPECALEYSNPRDRRYHAQPVACQVCGPTVWLTDGRENRLDGFWASECGRLLNEGAILAVKGLGGFHLVCDAFQREAIIKLRRRKSRPQKPLAVMCRDIETVKEHCIVSPREEELLKSHHAPIVLLKRKVNNSLPEELAPGVATLGVMLPYTPMHLVLLDYSAAVLVMTSGNRSGLPLVKDNQEAYAELGRIADYFLMHNREILNRCDDSVVSLCSGEEHFFRRSRGYVPAPVPVPVSEGPVVLGSGGEMKNTFCLLIGGNAYLSQHIGDISLLEGQESYKRSLDNYCRLLGINPEVVAQDPHPDYHVDGLTSSIQSRWRFNVQHHHAHMASCMAENGIDEPVIGLIMDGTGYGLDGKIWGFEILAGDYGNFERICHLAYLPLPGGERTVKNPWVCAVSCLIAFLGDTGYETARSLFPDKTTEIKIIKKMIEENINSPPASSCGRLFDAVAAILGVCKVNTYDGQAAIELGETINKERGHTSSTELGSGVGGMSPIEEPELRPYPFTIIHDIIDPALMFEAILMDLQSGIPVLEIARRFHDTVAAMAVEGAEKARKVKGINIVVLSGGCWHNKYLSETARRLLQRKGFEVYYHRVVPPGDGGISLGQAMVGYTRWKNRVLGGG